MSVYYLSKLFMYRVFIWNLVKIFKNFENFWKISKKVQKNDFSKKHIIFQKGAIFSEIGIFTLDLTIFLAYFTFLFKKCTFLYYNNFLRNHKVFCNSWAYIIYQSFLCIIVLLFQFWYTGPKYISFIINNFFHKIKNVTVNNSSIVKSVKICSKWSLDQHNSLSSWRDILI